MKNISILFNSRNRVPILTQCLSLIQQNSFDINNIEVLVRFDDDDQNSINAIPQLKSYFPFFIPVVGKRSGNIQANLNELAKQSCGRYLFGINDDIFIEYCGWDLITLTRLDVYLQDKPDGIVFGAIECSSIDKHMVGGWYASVPLISRQAVDTLGFFLHDRFKAHGADVGIYRVYQAVNRICKITDFTVKHLMHSDVQSIRQMDTTAQEFIALNGDVSKLDHWTFDISNDVTRLQNHIDSYAVH